MGLCNAAAVVITALAFLATPVGASAPINAGDSDIPAPLITQQIDMQDLVTLGGNTRSEANPSNDRGAVAAAMPLEHLELQLQRSSAGEGRVQSFIEALHDPASPRFHEWLTAEDFGRRFGAAPADIAAVEAWLSGYGFRLGPVYPGGMVIDFSGTAGQGTAAFHTAIHLLAVRGEGHFGKL